MSAGEFAAAASLVRIRFRTYQRRGHADELRQGNSRSQLEDAVFLTRDTWRELRTAVGDFAAMLPLHDRDEFRTRRRELADCSAGSRADELRALVMPPRRAEIDDVRRADYVRELLASRRRSIDSTAGAHPARVKHDARTQSDHELGAALTAVALLAFAAEAGDDDLGAVARGALWG